VSGAARNPVAAFDTRALRGLIDDHGAPVIALAIGVTDAELVALASGGAPSQRSVNACRAGLDRLARAARGREDSWSEAEGRS